MKIYLASNYSTWPQMQLRANQLRDLGHQITSEWITGAHQSDDHAKYAEIDLRNIDEADALIFWSESPLGSRTRGGKHVEFGYAVARGKQLYIVGKPSNIFHHLPRVIQRYEFADILQIIGRAA